MDKIHNFILHLAPCRLRRSLVVLLLIGLIQKINDLEWKPPVTVGLMIANFFTFFGLRSGAWSALQQWMLQPKRILEQGEWTRLVFSGFLHLDEVHLYYNMASLLWKGVQLERRLGSKRFAKLVAELLLVSNGLYVLIALLLSGIDEHRHLYHTIHVAGFSGVLFGLKVVLSHKDEGITELLGIRWPTKYICWVELFLASILVPNCSFLGHLCGILAGLLHVQLVEPSMREWASRAWRRADHRRGRRLGGDEDRPRARASTGGASGSGFGSAAAYGYGPRASGGSCGAARASEVPTAEKPATSGWQQPDCDDEDEGEADWEGEATEQLSTEELRRKRLERLEREQQGPRYRSTRNRQPDPRAASTAHTGINTQSKQQYAREAGREGEATEQLSTEELRTKRLERLEREQQGPRFRSNHNRQPDPRAASTAHTGINTQSKQSFSCAGVLGGGGGRASYRVNGAARSRW